MKLQPPWPAEYSINARSPYGPRKHPITRKVKMHHGVDVAAPIGTQLTAPADGVVVHKGSGASGGNTLILKHAEDLYTVYYHLHKPSPLAKGAEVKTGDPIALVGNTGRSTGPHLHFEVRRSQKWGDTIDPEEFLVPHGVDMPEEPVEAVTEAPVAVQEVVEPAVQTPLKRKPMSEGLRRWFEIRRALK